MTTILKTSRLQSSFKPSKTKGLESGGLNWAGILLIFDLYILQAKHESKHISYTGEVSLTINAEKDIH